MKAQPRINTIALAVATAAASLASLPSQADSGVGVDTTLGNALNPATMSSIRDKDPDGLGQTEFSRNPTGFLNAEPNLIREPGKTSSGWHYTGSIEAGAIGVSGDRKNAKFKEYKDLNDSLYINTFGVQAEKPDSATFVEVLGGGVAQDDQYYGISFGRYNDWKIKAFLTETPHVFTTTYRNLWSGTGSKTMSLRSLTPGGTTNAATTDANIQAAALATPYSELGIVRTKGGIRFDMNLGEQWSVYASYTNEKKEGSRPFGLVMGGGGGTGGVEIPESVDNTTHDIFVGARWKDALSALNLQAQVSLFRNDINTMTVQNPMFLAAANGIASHTTATYDMHPDNNYYNVKAEYARSLPNLMKGRFTAVVSLASLRQDDKFIPSTTFAGATANGVAGGSWNTLDSLSKDSANAKIDTRLVDLGLSLTPIDKLDVRGKYRHYETKNSTEYFACNPLTGQWGRLINDGSGAAIVTNLTGCGLASTPSTTTVPSAGNINIRNIPYEYKQDNISLAADYRLNRNNSLNASLEREYFRREHRERKKTWEDKLKVGYVNRSLEDGTIRLSFENDRRRGSDYISDPYHEFYSASLGLLPTAAGANVNTWVHVLAELRKFDLANRNQNILNARVNYALAPNLDGGVSLQLKDIKYPDSDYGRTDRQTQNSLNFDLTLRHSEDLNLYGFYSFQDGKIEQANIQPSAVNCLLGTNVASIDECGEAGSVRFPLNRGWNLTQKDRNDALGFGLTYNFTKARLDLNYTYVKGRSKISYSYDPTGGILTALQQTLAGNGFPSLRFKQNILEANLTIPVNKKASVRLLYRYEDGRFSDWHYDGVDVNPSPAANQQTYLDAGPEDYKAHVVGAFVKYEF